MNKKILNLIIIFSLIGILAISARDYFLGKRKTKPAVIATPSPTPPTGGPTPTIDLKVPCQNKYFNFQKGTAWRYKLTSEIEIGGDLADKTKPGQTSQKKTAFFTNEIVEASPSSVMIETQFEGDEEKKTTTLTCKKSGLYGFPYPLMIEGMIENLNLKTPISGFVSLDKSILFLPSDESLKEGESWQSQIGLNLNLPLPIPGLSLELENTVLKEEKRQVLNLGEKNTLTVESAISFNQSVLKDLLGTQDIKLPENKLSGIESQLTEGVGLLSLDIDFNLQNLSFLKINLTLNQFKTP